MQATRQDILDHLRRHNQATVKELGERLGLTSTGIRQHLTVLERDGLIEAHEERGHVGRPALVYRLTTATATRSTRRSTTSSRTRSSRRRGDLLGTDALQQLMKNVAARFAEPHIARARRAAAGRARARGRDAIHPGARQPRRFAPVEGEDFLIEQHTCPFRNVATKNSAVCALDVEFVRQLVGADARLTHEPASRRRLLHLPVRPRGPAPAADARV